LFFKHKTFPLINSKIAIIIEMNTQMRNDSTHGLRPLSPIDTSSCILLTLYYLNQNQANVDAFAVTDKLNQLDLKAKNSQQPTEPDLNAVENIFKEVIYLFCTKPLAQNHCMLI
jgi:hypothetical protein